MAVRLSALAEQNLNRILNSYKNLNKKGKRKPKSRRKLLTSLSDDENASVSEYEPPAKKAIRNKKVSDKETNSDNDKDYRPYLAAAKRVSKSKKISDKESNSDYRPSTSAVNGYSRKRKMFSRVKKNTKLSSEKGSRSDESPTKFKPKATNHASVRLITMGEPSTSKTTDARVLPERRARMIHVEKNNDSSDEDEEINPVKTLNFTVNGKHRFLKSESDDEGEDEDEDEASEEAEENNTNKKDVNEDDDNEQAGVGSDSDVEDESDEESSESAESLIDDSDFELRPDPPQKSTKKTVKVIYPKRRVQESVNTDSSENSKENLAVSNQNNMSSRLRRKASEPKARGNKGKYPLRQTTRKNLAEESSFESGDDNLQYKSTTIESEDDNSQSKTRRSSGDDNSHSKSRKSSGDDNSQNKTRRTSQRIVNNGASFYNDNFNESDDSDQNEFSNAKSLEEDDSDAYLPPGKMQSRGRGRGCKRQRSSDESSAGHVHRQLRKSRTLKKTNVNGTSRRGRTCRARKSVRNNSESEFSISNDSDSDFKVASISVSSRGRVRKLTPRAQAMKAQLLL